MNLADLERERASCGRMCCDHGCPNCYPEAFGEYVPPVTLRIGGLPYAPHEIGMYEISRQTEEVKRLRRRGFRDGEWDGYWKALDVLFQAQAIYLRIHGRDRYWTARYSTCQDWEIDTEFNWLAAIEWAERLFRRRWER